MEDPKPENIVGEKRAVHRVEHRIDWGYLTLGLGALAVGYVLYRLFVQTGDSDQNDEQGGDW